DANAYYRKAVEIGKELLDGSSKEEQKQHILGLSSRYNNLGLLYQEIQEYERSEGFIEEAMKYDKMVDNARGFATRHGNLGLIHLDQSDFEAARKSFEEAESIAKSLGSARALSYVAMNWGSYYRATGSNEKAIEYFLSAAEQADNLDVRVVTTSLKNLEEIYESQGNTDLASEIDSRLKKLSTTTRVKEVTFVLDYSGSMAGKRIISAVAGMRNIFKDQIGDRDTVSIISFDSESRILVPPKVKGENIREYMLTFDNLNRPYGATAMYDALGEAFNDFLNRPSSSTQWIICLTDGDDNSSRRYNPSLVKDMARRSVGVNLVIIGVGNLRDQRVLEDICAATDRGNYIHVSQGVGDAITQAFEEVSSMLSEVEVEGFVPDF
ncbi:MAG: VWA domain-containing protein, partial [Candidatus Kariarchaeaceae archaeon]